ncbi:MAG: hypothetical protein IJY06_09790 [Oscillospiraceae bacterium]|nr:hypothetical protein [Oscillospiraceae bacterium]
MKLKPKGRKIYRYKTRFERLKGFLRNSGAVFMTIAGIGVLVFVGYSAGGPIVAFLEEQKILTPASSIAETEAEPAQTQEPSDPTAESVTDVPEETSLPAAEEVWMQGYTLMPEALFTEDALRQAVARVPEETTHVFVPLKDRGGSLYFAAAVQDAGISGAVVAAMPLETIRSIIADAGYTPSAVINTLEDTIYPQAFPKAGYTIAGTDTCWLNADGKPMLSPFSPIAKDYLCTLTAEIADAGFAAILCEGLAFPDFSEDDLAQLDPRAGASDRGTVLAQLLNAMQESAGDAQMIVSIDGAQLLAGRAELLHAGTQITPDHAAVTIQSGTESELAAMQSELLEIPCVFLYNEKKTLPDSVNRIFRQEEQTTERTDTTETSETTESTDTTESETGSESTSAS